MNQTDLLASELRGHIKLFTEAADLQKVTPALLCHGVSRWPTVYTSGEYKTIYKTLEAFVHRVFYDKRGYSLVPIREIFDKAHGIVITSDTSTHGGKTIDQGLYLKVRGAQLHFNFPKPK